MGHDTEHALLLAQAVRAACERAAKQAYQEASMSGLCSEGAWEAALGAIRTLDLTEIVEAADRDAPGSS